MDGASGLARAAPEQSRRRPPFAINVRGSILRLACILILGCLSTATLFVGYLISQSRQQIANEALGIARASAQASDREITGAWALMSGLSTSPSLKTGDLRSFHRQLIETPKPQDSWIVLLSLDGTMLASSRDPFDGPKPRLACGERCQATFRTREPQVSDLVLTTGTSQPVVRASMPVIAANEVAFVLGIPLPSEMLSRVFEERRLPEGWTGALYDRNGATITRSTLSSETVGQAQDPLVWAEIGLQSEGLLETRNKEGVPVLLAFARSNVGWVATAVVPLSLFNARRTNAAVTAVGGVALLLLAGIAVASRTSRRIEKPVRALETAAVAAENEKSELAQLHTAFWESTDENLFVIGVTPEGRFVFEANNPVSERTSGLTRAGAFGKEARDLVAPEIAARWEGYCRRCVELGAPIRCEETLVLFPEERSWEVVLAPVRDASGCIVRLVGSGRDITDRKKNEAEIRSLVERLLRAEDDERQRIAQELHDSTAQHLVGASLFLEVLARRSGSDSAEAKEAIAEIHGLIHRAQNEIRLLSYVMHPQELARFGLSAAVRAHVEGFARKAALNVKVELVDDLGDLPYPAQLALFRILQEALTNVHRHANATSALVRLEVRAGRLFLAIKDDGQGGIRRDRNGRPRPFGLGLMSMSARVRQLGGRLRVCSGRRGTVIAATIPLAATRPNSPPTARSPG